MQVTDRPLISIALCVYNGERFLAKQLDSIITQDYEYLEIIAVDDCSSDKSWELLKHYQDIDNRIRIYRNNKNLGYVKNFEKAITLSTGRYFALADQDDAWEGNKISTMIDAIGNNIMVYHDSDYIDEDGRQIGTQSVSSLLRVYDGSSCIPFILANCVHGHATLFNSEIKKYIFPFDGRFPHDWWLTYVAFNVGSVKYIDKVLVHYRQHQSAITDSFMLVKQEALQRKPARGLERISLNLNLLKYCTEFQYNKDNKLIDSLWYSFSGLAKGKERLSSFWLLVKYYGLLFYIQDSRQVLYRKKGFFSRLNTIRKICFE